MVAMGVKKTDLSTTADLRTELRRITAALDRHRELVLAAKLEAQEHGLELASLARLYEDEHANGQRAARTRKSDAKTIKRLTVTLAEGDDALASMTAKRDKSVSKAVDLQADVVRRTLEVHEKEELLALVLHTSVDGVLVYRAVQGHKDEIIDFECVLHNPAASKIYGIDGLEGKRLLDLHPDVRTKGLWERYVQVLQTGEPFEGEYLYGTDGNAQWFRVLASKLDIGIAITFSDITPRKHMEAQLLVQMEALQAADRTKNQFLGIISHELRTPINAIMGFTSILEDELGGPLNAVQCGYLAKISTGADVLLALVDNLLDMSRIQAGKLNIHPEPCAFERVVADVLANLEPLVQPRVLVNKVPAGLPLVFADERRVAQVLTNLVANAIKFTPPSGAISVRAKRHRGMLRGEVTDTGVGISAADQDSLFDPFVQVDMSTTRVTGGTGLGLSISRGLVEAQGGTMGVDSKEGQGSTFWFTLPLAPPKGG
ncbi:MAG: histidine kinase [Cyanobacteria bacterium RYN_339]|nr:histidine kinase [Cyanobacteria bacterium RYN_339]